MTYIILAAGRGSNLQPLTLKYPKTSYKLDENTTILQRLVRNIRKKDNNGEIVVVIGYLADNVKTVLAEENVKFVVNPFYEVTNSITSVWFARDYLERENVTIIHGDVVYDDYISADIIIKNTEYPFVVVDSSCVKPGDYNAVTDEDRVMVMSYKLEQFDAKYCCMTKLDAVSARLLKREIDKMIHANMYNQFFEDSLVQMIMFQDFQLNFVDIKGHSWTEVDSVDDLLKAQQIHRKSEYIKG